MSTDSNNSIDDLNLHDLEDYSNNDVIHDQLPTVEDARMHARQTLSKTNGSSNGKKKFILIFLGILVVVLASVGIAVGVGKPQKDAPLLNEDQADYYDRLITSFALNATHDFAEKYSYQSKAKLWLLQDDEILPTATHEELRQRYALYAFFHATQPLHVWWKSQNRHYCEWRAITCSTLDDGTRVVTRLELRDHGMSGAVPPETAMLKNLQVLNINANHNLLSVPDELCDFQPPIDIKADCERVQCDCCTNCQS